MFHMEEIKMSGRSKMKLPKYLLCSLKYSYHFLIHYWQEMK